MKKILFVLLLSISSVVLTACSNNEQRFVCSFQNNKDRTEGLIIKNNVANLGLFTDMKFCGTTGTKNLYNSECGKTKIETYHYINFDTISYTADLVVKLENSYNTFSYQCKKIN